MNIPARPARRTPLQQAQSAAEPSGLRRAQRAPIAPAPEPTRSAAPSTREEARTVVRQQRQAQRETLVSTHQGRSTVHESARVENLGSFDIDPDARGEVRISHGKTINMGNYETVRVDVAVTFPCTAGTVQEALEIAHDHVVEGLAREESFLLGTAAPARRANRRG